MNAMYVVGYLGKDLIAQNILKHILKDLNSPVIYVMQHSRQEIICGVISGGIIEEKNKTIFSRIDLLNTIDACFASLYPMSGDWHSTLVPHPPTSEVM